MTLGEIMDALQGALDQCMAGRVSAIDLSCTTPDGTRAEVYRGAPAPEPELEPEP